MMNSMLRRLTSVSSPRNAFDDLCSHCVALAENFDPGYIKINPNGTVPSLTHPSFPRPLVDTREILTYIDGSRSTGTALTPSDPKKKELVDKLIALVHSEDVDTNLILLRARDEDEFEAKKASPWHDFVRNRQNELEKQKAANPSHPFYGPKAVQNGVLSKLYDTPTGPEHEEFFKLTRDMYHKFATGMDRLESLILLPYAVGENLTLADLHIVPWFSHSLVGVGTTEPEDFDKLEKHIQKTVPDFKIGPKTKEWWLNMTKRPSFQKVYATLH